MLSEYISSYLTEGFRESSFFGNHRERERKSVEKLNLKSFEKKNFEDARQSKGVSNRHGLKKNLCEDRSNPESLLSESSSNSALRISEDF